MKDADTVWKQFDKVFAEASKLFAEAEHLFETEHTTNTNAHKIRFSTKTFWQRVKLAAYFNRLALCVIFKGKATLVFKHKVTEHTNN